MKADINECLKNPCQSYHQCVDLEDGYECKCLPGYGGDGCEEYVGVCGLNGWTSPCGLNGYCIDKHYG